MYVVTVHFHAKPECREQFLRAMLENAAASRTLEPGCRQFDVTVAPDDPCHVFLYEIYDSEAAFGEHRRAAHYLDFVRTTTPWLAGKQVAVFHRLAP